MYATTTSERASKGQGGNEYLRIEITDEYKQIIMSINAQINGNIVTFNNRNWINNKADNFMCKIETKGKKQKDEHIIIPYMGNPNDTLGDIIQ